MGDPEGVNELILRYESFIYGYDFKTWNKHQFLMSGKKIRKRRIDTG